MYCKKLFANVHVLVKYCPFIWQFHFNCERLLTAPCSCMNQNTGNTFRRLMLFDKWTAGKKMNKNSLPYGEQSILCNYVSETIVFWLKKKKNVDRGNALLLLTNVETYFGLSKSYDSPSLSYFSICFPFQMKWLEKKQLYIIDGVRIMSKRNIWIMCVGFPLRTRTPSTF